MEYFPEVIQVIATTDFNVYIYFDDGSIKLFNAKDLIQKGIFTKLKDKNLFVETCTVLNGTLAWDINGKYDTSECLDLDPFELYNMCPEIEEPKELFESFKTVRPLKN